MVFPNGFSWPQGWAFAQVLASALPRGRFGAEIARFERHKTPKRSFAGLSKVHRRWYIPLAPRGIARVAFSGSLRTGSAPRALAKPVSLSALCEGAQRFIAGRSSPVARQAHNLKVIGSNPIPATKIDTKNPAISMDCWVFVFKVEPSPQQKQWLSFVGSNHPQPIAECISAAGEWR